MRCRVAGRERPRRGVGNRRRVRPRRCVGACCRIAWRAGDCRRICSRGSIGDRRCVGPGWRVGNGRRVGDRRGVGWRGGSGRRSSECWRARGRLRGRAADHEVESLDSVLPVRIIVLCFNQHVVRAIGDCAAVGPSINSIDSNAGAAAAGEAVRAAGVSAAADDGAGGSVINFKFYLVDASVIRNIGCLNINIWERAADRAGGRVAYGEHRPNEPAETLATGQAARRIVHSHCPIACMMEMAVAIRRRELLREVQSQACSVAGGQRGLRGEGNGPSERCPISGKRNIGRVINGRCAAAAVPPLI